MDHQALRRSVDSFLKKRVEYEVKYLKILAEVLKSVRAVTVFYKRPLPERFLTRRLPLLR